MIDATNAEIYTNVSWKNVFIPTIFPKQYFFTYNTNSLLHHLNSIDMTIKSSFDSQLGFIWIIMPNE